MCLKKIRDFKIHHYYGYKVMCAKNINEFVSIYYRDNHSGMVLDKWYEDVIDERRICTKLDVFVTYRAGFHIYRLKEYPKKLAELFDCTYLVKVKFRDVIAKGTECESDVIVARQMKIVKKYE